MSARGWAGQASEKRASKKKRRKIRHKKRTGTDLDPGGREGGVPADNPRVEDRHLRAEMERNGEMCNGVCY